jgi:hypothetical protein
MRSTFYRASVGRAALLVLLAAPIVVLWPRPPCSAADDELSPPRVLLPGPIPYVGVASCASMACHNAQGPKGSLGSEYTTWAAFDPHGRAFSVLRNERSQRIAKNLHLKKPAHQEDLCLKCHVSPDWEQAARTPGFTLEDGVGCESCHGPAGRWLTEHFKAGWRRLTPAQKQRQGMNDTKGLLGRARTCVVCHVGTGNSDVNHDLIAAGHPRLNFEFAAFHAVLPHHWDDRKDKAPLVDRRGQPDFEARAWVVGQLVTARAALQLLADRARLAEKEPKKQPWPEFAEYDCYACHHDLKAQSWRQSEKYYGKRLPGSLPWGDWYFSMTPEALVLAGGDPTLVKIVSVLKGKMQRAYPPMRAVAKEAAKADARLAEALERWLKEADQPLPIVRAFAAIAKEKQATASWDATAQHYLALAALYNAWADMGRPTPELPAGVRGRLKQLAHDLRAPQRFEPQAIRWEFLRKRGEPDAGRR